jgi:3D (Asp-Asp-Asp) domain-containing protein
MNHSRFTHLCRRTVLLIILVSLPSTLSVTAQEGEVGPESTSPIALPDTMRTIREAAEPTEKAAGPSAPDGSTLPSGTVDPPMIAKTFFATAYCLKGQTAAGVPARLGVIAADPNILPLGSVVRIYAGIYSGIYSVLDTGGAIRGQRIDLFFPTRAEAMRFGSRRIKVEILRRGWDPVPTPGNGD